MSWEMVQLGDVIQTLKGYAFKSGHYVESGVPIVRASNFTMDSISYDDLKFYTEDEAAQFRKYELSTDDVLIQTVGSWESNPASVVGKVVRVPQLLDGALLNQNIVKVFPADKDRLDLQYLFYRLKCHDFKRHNIGNAVGAANQASITLDTIRAFTFSLPNIAEQRRIATILRGYDNLIENNQKQIKLLEETAQRLYKEWFVDLRFPGYETTPVIDGVPERWMKYKFSEIASIMSGGTPKTDVKEYYDGDIPFYTPKDSDGAFFTFDTITHISKSGLDHCNSQHYPAGTVIITARGTVGKTTILAMPMAMNQSCYALKCDDLNSPYYLFFSLNKEVAALKTMANGGVFNTIIVKTFDSIHLTVPTEEVLTAFDAMVSPMMEQIKAKMQQNVALAEARDRLLPKLMNGEIEV